MRKPSPLRHTTDIRQDERIADLLAAHGHAGYGVYWMILEILHSHETMQMEYDPKQIRRMAAQIGLTHQDFHNMLQDMIHDYDLFEVVGSDPSRGQRGKLRSTIIYRKPRKPKKTIIAPDTPQGDVATNPVVPGSPTVQNITTSESTTKKSTQAPQSNDKHTTAEEQHPTESFQLYEELKNYIDKNAPRVNTFKEPLTIDQVAAIRANYDEELILFVLEDMQQTKELSKQHSSAYQAFQLFAKNFMAQT